MTQDLFSKLNFFQEIQMLPKAADFNYEGWLDNFDSNERSIAERILDFFVYIPEDITNQLFRTVIGKAGYYFRTVDSDWDEQNFHNKCLYSYVPGENGNVTDSGVTFVKKAKDVIGIDENHILSFGELFKTLYDATTPQNVILTDDFVGTGAQCDHAWNQKLFPSVDKSLKDIVKEGSHKVIYVPLIVNYVGKMRIEGTCSGLHLDYAYELGPEWNLFSERCLCWDGKGELYRAGTELIRKKSLSLGITEEKGQVSIRGFGAQGLALAFSHCIPDACPAIFFVKKNGWVPLKVRH